MTGTLKARVSGAWVPILGSGQEAANTARWNSAWGVIGRAFGTTNQTGITAPTALTGVTVTATLVVGRRYRVSLSSGPQISDTGTAEEISVNRDGASIGARSMSVAAGNVEQVGDVVAVFDETAGGSHTFTGSISRVLGTGTVGNVATGLHATVLTVEDVGPTTPASIAPPTAGPRVVASGNALGIVAVAAMKNVAGASVAANTPIDVSESVSVFLAVGRRYRLSGSVRATSGTAGSAYLRVQGNVPTNDTWVYLSGNYDQMFISLLMDGTGQTESFKLLFQPTVAASVYSDQPVSYFYIEDVGPNTSPALPIPVTPPAWTPLPFASTWTNFGGANGPCGYRKIGDVVTLRGLATSTGTATTIATMPAGFRPAVSYIGSAVSQDNFGEVRVNLDGTVVVSVPTSVANGTWMTLNQISYSTTP